MRIRNKFMALMLTGVLACSTLLTGCGGSGNDSKTKDGKANLKVFLFMSDYEKEVYQKMIDKFEEEHADTIGNIDFQVTTKDEYTTTLKGMMTSGDMPDVFYMEPVSVADYVKNGYVANLTPLLEENNISTDDLYQNVLDNYRYDGSTQGQGNLYALPKDGSTFAYAYNKDLFDEAGLPYPDPEDPYTYEEFVEVCQKLTKDTDGDGEIDQWGCGNADIYMLYQYVWSNGTSFLSDDYKTVTVDTPEFKDALQKYVDLTLKYKVTPTVEQDASLGVYQRWMAGQEAFYACGTWEVSSLMDKETFPYEWDLCAYPTLSTGVSYTWNGTVGYCISEKSENKKEALELISYLSTDLEGQKIVSGVEGNQSIQLPNIKSYAEGEFKEAIENKELDFPSNYEVFFNYLNGTDKYQGRMMETTYTPNTEWLDIFWEGLVNVKSGKVSVDDYVKEMQPKMQEALDTAWENAE